ncbi:hypothetical protein HD806DRAFT_512619 [Xylariaceae sp. AK1471]|nr:hypothetical protein HD806DRAFT_512619 [Xylariaceae sp. AK1471]
MRSSKAMRNWADVLGASVCYPSGLRGEGIAREIFTRGWQILRERRLEELLLPLGRALAWSCYLDGPEGSAGREEDAVAPEKNSTRRQAIRGQSLKMECFVEALRRYGRRRHSRQ